MTPSHIKNTIIFNLYTNLKVMGNLKRLDSRDMDRALAKLMFISLYICKVDRTGHLTEVPETIQEQRVGSCSGNGYFSMSWRISPHYRCRIINICNLRT